MEILADSLTGVALEQAVARIETLVRTLRSRRASSSTKNRYISAEAARMHPIVTDYLIDKMISLPVEPGTEPASVMQIDLHGEIVSVPVSVVTRGNVELGELRSIYKPDAAWQKNEYVRLREEMGGRIYDNECYTATDIQMVKDGVRIEGALTSYGSALANLDSLEWELLDCAARVLDDEGRDPAAVYRTLDKRLKQRRAVESRTANWLLHGGRPFKAISVSTLLVYNDAGTYKIMVGKRSAETGAHADLFHVIPACMFQPELGQRDAEWNILHSVLKEYGEELFNKELDTSALDHTYFYDQWTPVRELRQALESGACSFHISGLVVNLLNLRPEVCALILVHDPAWWKTQHRLMRHNWEYVDHQLATKLATAKGRAWTDLRLDTIEQQYLDLFGSSSGMWVPPGLAAFWLGIDVARQELRNHRSA